MELDEAEQRRIAARFRPELEERGIDVVFVGSTAIVGLELFPRTSADADALAAPGTGTNEARQAIEAIVDGGDDLVLVEKGRGAVSLAKVGPEGSYTWEVDVIVPSLDLIPPDAAERVHARATETDIGPTAIPEHVLAMKAIAYGDSLRDGDAEGVEKYESDLLEFADGLGRSSTGTRSRSSSPASRRPGGSRRRRSSSTSTAATWGSPRTTIRPSGEPTHPT